MLDSTESDRVTRSRGSWNAAGEAGARHSSAGPSRPAPTGAKAPLLLPHWTDPSAHWLCVEHRADSGAHVRLDLRRLGFEVHWPREVVRIRGRDDVLRPYFPGYLFALPAATNASWHEVKDRVRHLVQIVGVRELGRPAHPPQGFVLGLIEKARGAIDGAIPPKEDALLDAPIVGIGDTVRLNGTALAGLEAVVSAERGARVKVLLHILGAEREITARRDRLGKVEKAG